MKRQNGISPWGGSHPACRVIRYGVTILSGGQAVMPPARLKTGS